MAKRKRNLARGIRLHGASYELNIQRKGIRQFINLETADFSEAIKRAEKVRANPDLLPSAGLTEEIERFIAYKLRMGEYTRHTALTKKNKLLLMQEAVPDGITAAGVSTKHIQTWHDSMVDELTSSTIHGYLMTARAFFRWSIEVAKMRRNNPLNEVKIVKLEKRAREKFCSYEQRDKLISNCEDEELQFIQYCGFHAGLRFNEIVQAVPSWFDMEHRRIKLTKTATMKFKDNEERTIPMTVEFHRFLKSYGLREPFMIAPDVIQGKWIYRYDFRAKFMKYVREQKLEWVTPHIMRHTFASLLVSSGESIYKVAVWLGDDVKTTQDHYGHLAPDEGGIEKAFSKRHKKK